MVLSTLQPRLLLFGERELYCIVSLIVRGHPDDPYRIISCTRRRDEYMDNVSRHIHTYNVHKCMYSDFLV